MADDSLDGQLKLSALRAKYPGSKGLGDDEFLRRVHKNLYPNLSAGDFVKKVDYDTQREQLLNEASKGGGTLHVGPLDTHIPINEANQQALANVGAGLTHAGQGVKQFFGGDIGSDADIEAQRVRDSALAENTPLGKTTQVAGQVLPTLVAPEALGSLATKIPGAGPVLARTMEALRGTRAGKFAQGTGYLPTAAKASVAGAAQGLLEPTTSTESKLSNAEEGALVGPLLPLGFKGVGDVAGRLTKLVTAGGARSAAAQKALDALTTAGDDPVKIKAALDNASDVIPLTTAAATGSKGWAGAENVSRARSGPAWVDTDVARMRAADANVKEATANAEQFKDLNKERGQAWDTNEGTAMTLFDQDKLNALLPKFRQQLEAAKTTRTGYLKGSSTRAALDEAGDALDSLVNQGIQPDLGHLIELRKKLNTYPSYTSSSATEKADPNDPAIRSIITALDNVMDKTTQDSWRGVTGDYAMRSPEVEQARASQRVRDQFYDQLGYPKTRTVGGVPDITAQSITRAVDAEAPNPQTNNLSPDSISGLFRTRDALAKQEANEQARRSSSGRNSSTASTLTQAAGEGVGNVADEMIGKVPLVGRAWNVLKQGSDIRSNRVYDEALRDSAKMKDLLNPSFTPQSDPTNDWGALADAMRAMGRPLAQPRTQAMYTTAGALYPDEQ